MSAYLKRSLIPRPLSSLRDVLAYNLRVSRLARGLSQEQLGFAAQLDRTFISQVERARVNISLDNLDKLARALALDAHELLHPPFSAWTPRQLERPTKQNAVNLAADGVEA
ncbi:helix-turn-helix domain-containing protein [Rivihabitans pingtungensis]|nr:helix-turn-helix transcriptional regulator [Rivihabitans pingtungensis]MCK6438137.1 helix-turn-helix transcriptional regulator [Rivihabitans pingtungensis]